LIAVSPNTSEASIKLPPDPLVILLKRIKQDLAQGNLVDAFEAYSRLTADAPDHQEIPRLLESILASLQSRSTQMLKQVGPFGLSVDAKDAQEMSKLYAQARTWRAGDEGLDVLARYWGIKFNLARADEARSTSEKENFRRTAQSALGDLSERSLRNMYLLMDVGWAWLRLNDNSTAQKYFNAAQELKADWAYPHFALGVLEMQVAEREIKKKSRLAMYEESIDSFTKAISLKHDFSRAYALRAISYAILKSYEEAAASGLQAIALDPKSAYAHFALGFAYFQKGKSAYRKSREEFNRALALDGVELDDVTKRSIQEWLAQIKKAIK
jgi:tetratricopeptide (TPR) repeat protein